MTSSEHARRSAVVFGARNLGKAMIDVLFAEGWAVAGVARTDATARRHHGGGSACPPRRRDRSGQRRRRTRAGLCAASRRHRPRDQRGLGVRWRSQRAVRRRPDRRCVRPMRSTPGPPRRPARPSRSCRPPAGSCAQQGRPATLIQVTGGSSRRAAAGRGLWAAGAFGVRAITQAAALELRDAGHPRGAR